MKREKINPKLRQLVWELYDNECSICGEEDKKILQIHHVDCDANNNDLDNLLLVCVICHALCFHPLKIQKMIEWVEKRL